MFFLTVPFTYVLEWYIMAHTGICIPFFLFSCARTLWRRLVHAWPDYCYQLSDNVTVIAIIFIPPLAERRALFDVRCWRRVLCC